MTSAISLAAALLVADLPLTGSLAIATGGERRSSCETPEPNPSTPGRLRFRRRTPAAVFIASSFRRRLPERSHRRPAGRGPHLRPLRPGDTRTFPVDPLPAGGVRAGGGRVVLDDNTAFGDDQTIASFFEKRVAERDGLRRSWTLQRRGAVAPAGRAAFRISKRPLRRHPTRGVVPHRSARLRCGRVAAANRREPTKATPTARVRAYARFFVARQQCGRGVEARGAGKASASA